MKQLSYLLALSLLAAGCGLAPPYLKVETAFRGGDYPAAVKTINDNEKDYGKSSRLLFLLDRLWAEHLAGDYKASNEDAEKANQLIDELYTTSVSGEALSFLGNDMSLPYEGENFERVMLHSVAMLNYAMLGQPGEALVEAKRADERMQQYADKAGPDKVVYKQDALSRYLSAVLYENQGGQARWDGFLDYKKCEEAFGMYARQYGTQLPRLLKCDLLRMASSLGEKDAYAEFSKKYGALPLPDAKGKGQVIVLLYEGLAPVKVSENLNLPVFLDDGTKQYFSAAFPRFVPRLTGFMSAQASADQGEPQPLELFQDVQAIAIRDLQDRVGLITAKAIARATVKYQAARVVQKQAREQGGAGAELLAVLGTNLYGIISEQADTRSWRSLPGRISLTRLYLEPGKHQVHLSINAQGGPITRDFTDVEVKPGKPVFLEYSIY